MKTFNVIVDYPEYFQMEARNKDEAYLRVLEGLPNDEIRGIARIEIFEKEVQDDQTGTPVIYSLY